MLKFLKKLDEKQQGQILNLSQKPHSPGETNTPIGASIAISCPKEFWGLTVWQPSEGVEGGQRMCSWVHDLLTTKILVSDDVFTTVIFQTLNRNRDSALALDAALKKVPPDQKDAMLGMEIQTYDKDKPTTVGAMLAEVLSEIEALKGITAG